MSEMPPTEPKLTMKKRPKIVISVNTSWNIVNFRGGLVKELHGYDFEIVALSPTDKYAASLCALGCRHVPLPMDNKGTNPFRDAVLFLRFLYLLQRERPDAFLSWTIKPNVYGSLASHLLRIPTINNVAGLGTAFADGSWLTSVVKLLYRLAFNRSACVFFQNRDDLEKFTDAGLVVSRQARLLPGSGIDLSRFAPMLPAPKGDGAGPVFLLIARLLWDKGVGQYVEAARKVRAVVPNARFRILGFVDAEGRAAVPRETIEAWVKEGVIEYLGRADDVRPHITAADCVVLPSYYREGTPRCLLEAAAMAKPLITTDMPGCREVVDDGVNGWLCRPRDAHDLANKMFSFLEASEALRLEMGRRSRLKAERDFADSIVIDAYRVAISSALKSIES